MEELSIWRRRIPHFNDNGKSLKYFIFLIQREIIWVKSIIPECMSDPSLETVTDLCRSTGNWAGNFFWGRTTTGNLEGSSESFFIQSIL